MKGSKVNRESQGKLDPWVRGVSLALSVLEERLDSLEKKVIAERWVCQDLQERKDLRVTQEPREKAAHQDHQAVQAHRDHVDPSA